MQCSSGFERRPADFYGGFAIGFVSAPKRFEKGTQRELNEYRKQFLPKLPFGFAAKLRQQMHAVHQII